MVPIAKIIAIWLLALVIGELAGWLILHLF
jgi:hypothetical protein